MLRVNRVRYRASKAGIAACAVGPELKGACHRVVANKALPYAKATSPRSTRRHRHYADSFNVEDGLLVGYPDHHPMTRVMSRLVNTARHATAVEVGAVVTLNGRTYETPAHRVLLHTLEYLHATKAVT